MADLDKRIPELPNISYTSAIMMIPIYDPITDTTYRMNYALVQPGASTNDYRWNELTDYGIGDIVTQSDKVWESIATPNIGNVPVEDGGYWEERSKSKSGFVYWAAGVYLDDQVFVLYTLGSDTFFYELADPARPFNSIDFEDELADDKWRRIGTITDILGVLLDGFNPLSTDNVTDADSILTALEKLQANKARSIFKDGSVAMESNFDLNNFKIIQLAAATANGEAVNFEQLNAAIDGIKPKDDCRAATTEEIVLNDEQTVDDVVLVAGDRVLVKDQSAAEENGIYIVVAAGDWTRALDADTNIELQGAFTQISEGTDNEGTAWIQYALDIVVDTDDILWRNISSSVPDASPTTKGKVKLAGDLAGTADLPTVPALALKEVLSNKATDFSTINDDLYPSVQAVEDRIAAGEHFKGKFTTIGGLETAYPTAEDGDYAVVDAGPGTEAKEYIWDEDEGWIQSSGVSVAAAVTVTPVGNIASTNVQAALAELDTEKEPVIGFTPENVANKDVDATFAANSDVKYPSQKAVKTAMDLKAPLASPALTGNPTAPTQSVGDGSTKIATTAFVQAEIVSLNEYVHAVASMYNLTF